MYMRVKAGFNLVHAKFYKEQSRETVYWNL